MHLLELKQQPLICSASVFCPCARTLHCRPRSIRAAKDHREVMVSPPGQVKEVPIIREAEKAGRELTPRLSIEDRHPRDEMLDHALARRIT